MYDEGSINLSLYAYICLHCLFTFACSSSTKSIVKAFKGIIYRSTYIDNPLLTENISNNTNVPFAFSSKRDQKCINVQSVVCSSSSVHFIVEARDSYGISKLVLIQLILPYKVGCICGSLEIPLLSLVEAGAGHWRRKITTQSHNLSRTPESSMTRTRANKV